MDRPKWIITGVVSLGLIILVAVWISMHRVLKRPRPSKAEAGAPVCVLSGDFRNPRQTATKGFDNLNTMVRLRFQAGNLSECKQSASDYCHARASDGFVPGALKMSFRLTPFANYAEKFAVTGHCIFEKIAETD